LACPIRVEKTASRRALPGMRRAAESDSEIIARPAAGLAAALNDVLDDAAAMPQLEALVIVDESTEIIDRGLLARVRSALANSPSAIVGAIGGSGITSIAWWDHPERFGSLRCVPEGMGGLELAVSGIVSPDRRAGVNEVDIVDGSILALSPWAVRSTRFDDALGPVLDALAADLCFQARAAEGRVAVAELGVIRHRRQIEPSERGRWIEAYEAFGRKWEPRWGPVVANQDLETAS